MAVPSALHEGVRINWGGVIGIVAGVHRNVDGAGAFPVFAIWVRLVFKTYFHEESRGRCIG